MTETVFFNVFKRPALWDHRNKDCHIRDIVDTNLRQRKARITGQIHYKHWGKSDVQGLIRLFRDATSEIQDPSLTAGCKAPNRNRGS